MRRLSRHSMACLTLAAATGAARAQCPNIPKLMATDREANDHFGVVLSAQTTASGPSVMVGAPNNDTSTGGPDAGVVYTFVKVNGVWGQVSHIEANDAFAGDLFGTSLCWSDPYAIVGAPGGGVTGAVYFLERSGSTWTQSLRTVPSGAAGGDDIGRSVGLSGTWAVVGAPLHDLVNKQDAGSAYVYERTGALNWTYVTRLDGEASGDRFGTSVAIGGNIIVVGAPFGGYINWPMDHGYIHVYRQTSPGIWTFDDGLASNNPGANDHYGSAVATDGTTIVIGAPDDDSTAAQGGPHTDSGCVYIQRYVNGAWTIDGQIFASDQADNAHFGSSVAISGGRVMVGARGSQRVYVFRRLAQFQWVQETAYGDPDASGSFASSVDIDGTNLFIGDQNDAPGGVLNAGSVYVAPLSTGGMDTCEAALTVDVGTYSGCTTYNTLSGTTTCGLGGGGQGPDAWFAYHATCTSTVNIDTNGSSFDTVLSVHSACPDSSSSNTMVCNDDAQIGVVGPSAVSFGAVAGQTYLVRVAGYGGAKGAFMLNIAQPPAANDHCANAQAIGNGTFVFATCSADTDGLSDTACTFSGTSQVTGDLWYKYTAAITGTTRVNLCGSAFDTRVAVYAGASCPAAANTAIACNDDATQGTPCAGTLSSYLTFPAAAGQVYLVRVGGYAGNTGIGTMTISQVHQCAVDIDGNGQITPADVALFVSIWFSSVSQGGLAGDWDQNGQVTPADVAAFVNAWFSALTNGC